MREDKKLNQLDTLITEVLEEEMNDIDISDEEIEAQWMKLQGKSKTTKVTRTKKSDFKKIAVIIGALIGLTVLNLPNSQTSAWKVPNIINIFSSNQNKTINQSLSVGEGLQIVDEQTETSIVIHSIEEARNMVSFNFKELPYTLEEGVIQGTLGGEEVLYLNYITNKGKISLIQMRQGLEFTQSVNVTPDSDVTEIKINDTLYSIAKISEERTKVIWSAFGVHHTIDIYYPIEIEDIKEMIKAME